MSEWQLSTEDEIWTRFGWFAFVWAIFHIPSTLIKHSAIEWTTDRTVWRGSLWIYKVAFKPCGVPIGAFFGVGWFIMYALNSTAAFLVWNQEYWEGAPGKLALLVVAWVVAALWVPIYYGWWPYSAGVSLIPIGVALGLTIGDAVWIMIEVDQVGVAAGVLLLVYAGWLALAFYTVAVQPFVLGPAIPCCQRLRAPKHLWADEWLFDADRAPVPRVHDPWTLEFMNKLSHPSTRGADALVMDAGARDEVLFNEK